MDGLGKLRDNTAKAKILLRIRRAEAGNLGDVAPVGEGVDQMRIQHGPGDRMSFRLRRRRLILLLCGGDKSNQDRGIRRAKAMDV